MQSLKTIWIIIVCLINGWRNDDEPPRNEEDAEIAELLQQEPQDNGKPAIYKTVYPDFYPEFNDWSLNIRKQLLYK